MEQIVALGGNFVTVFESTGGIFTSSRIFFSAKYSDVSHP